MFKQRQYVPLTATRKCPLDWVSIDAFYSKRTFSERLVRNPGFKESPGCVRKDDRLLPHKLISPEETGLYVMLMAPVPKELATAEQKPNKPIVQERRP